MGYKTNARALRLGISHDWTFKAHGPLPLLHLDHKLMRYVANLVEHVVPQAPQRVKTKGRYNYRAAVGPGIQGRLLVLRSSGQVILIMHYYLNVEAADERQKRSLERNLSNLVWLLQEESGYIVTLTSLNYFYYFWRMKLFTGRRGPRRLRSQMRRYQMKFPAVREEQTAMSAQMHPLRLTRRALRPWRRERYHARSFRPMVAAFMSQPFDADLVARTIATELQILRIKHRRFMYYARRLLDMGFYYWNRGGLLQGMKLEIRGRMTNFRRQVRRAQTKTYRWGSLKKADLRVEASHCRHLAYNRYGVIGVSLTFQQRIRVAERWEDRSAQSPLRAFALKGLLEQLGQERQVLPLPEQSLRHEIYGRAAPGVLDPAVSGVGADTGLERFNRHCYYRERLGHFHRESRKPYQRPLLLLRPMFSDLEEGFSNPHRFPVQEASLASFQLALRRQQQRRRQRQGLSTDPVAPTAYDNYRRPSIHYRRGGLGPLDPPRSPQGMGNPLRPHRRRRPWVRRRALSPAEAYQLLGQKKQLTPAFLTLKVSEGAPENPEPSEKTFTGILFPAPSPTFPSFGMSTLYVPRKPKRFRVHKSIPRGGLRLRSPRFTASPALVVASTHGQLNWRHLEAGRRFLVRQVRRSRVRVLAHLHQPLTAKSKQARMGKGKGKLRGWVAFVRPGTALYEVGPTGRRSWTHHTNPATRLRGRFPFERMAYKFSYGVQVRRRSLFMRRRGLSKPHRPGYGLGDGLNRVSALHPDGGERQTARVRRSHRLPPSPLNHLMGQLLRRHPIRMRDSRRPLMAQLLLHHWRHLVQRHQWTPLEPSPLTQLNNTLRSLDRLRLIYRMGRRFFRQQQRALTRREATAHPERWHMSFLERNHPLVHLHEPLDPAGGSLWLRRYPPRLLLWRRFVPSSESLSDAEESEGPEAPEPKKAFTGSGADSEAETSPETFPQSTSAASGETGAEEEAFTGAEEEAFTTTDSEAETFAPALPVLSTEEFSPPSLSLRFSSHSLRGLLQSADWGYGGYVEGEGGLHPMAERPPARLPDPGFLVPRSPESAAHAIVAAQDRGLRRLWVTQRAIYQHWWMAPWMTRPGQLSLDWRLSRRIWVGEHFQAAVYRANIAEVVAARAAQRKVLAHFKRRAEAFAERQAENLRERAEALAAGLVPPVLLLSKKTKLTDSERASKSAYRPILPPAALVSEPVLVVAVGDYPVEIQASLEHTHQQILWDVLQEHCADWGLALDLSRFAKPKVVLPGVGRLPLSWLVAWLGRLQGRLSMLRERLRYRQQLREQNRQLARRQRELRRRPRPYWFARLLRRSQWRYRSRFYRDQPKLLLPGPTPRAHPRPHLENPLFLRYRRRQEIYESLLQRRGRRRRRRARRRARLSAVAVPLWGTLCPGLDPFSGGSPAPSAYPSAEGPPSAFGLSGTLRS